MYINTERIVFNNVRINQIEKKIYIKITSGDCVISFVFYIFI